MRRALADDLSARRRRGSRYENEAPARGLIETQGRRLLAAVDAYDEAALKRCSTTRAAFGLEPFVHDLILPALAEIGRRWRPTTPKSTKHFAAT